MHEELARLLASLKESVFDIRGKMNEALKGQPPLEQFQGSEAALSALRTFNWAVKDVESEMGRVADFVQALEEKDAPAALASAIEAEINNRLKLSEDPEKDADGKGLVLLSTHKVAVDAAAKGVDEKVTEKVEEYKAVQGRRAQVAEILPGKDASKINDAFLQADGFDDRLKVLKERIEKLQGAGMDMEGDGAGAFLQRVAGMPLDDDGKADFDTQLKILQGVKGKSSGGGGGGGGTVPGTPESASLGGGGGEYDDVVG